MPTGAKERQKEFVTHVKRVAHSYANYRPSFRSCALLVGLLALMPRLQTVRVHLTSNIIVFRTRHCSTTTLPDRRYLLPFLPQPRYHAISTSITGHHHNNNYLRLLYSLHISENYRFGNHRDKPHKSSGMKMLLLSMYLNKVCNAYFTIFWRSDVFNALCVGFFI